MTGLTAWVITVAGMLAAILVALALAWIVERGDTHDSNGHRVTARDANRVDTHQGHPHR